MTRTQTVRFDIVSDVVCPWCYIGRKHLARALADRPELSVEIQWRPFMLHPFLGPEGMDRDELMTMKFGRSGGRMFERVERVGEEAGITFRFDRVRRVPDTTRAHCLLDWARATGAQDVVALALFAAYFEEGLDVSDLEVLASIAGGAGMDARAVRGRLEAGDDRERIRAEAEAARAEMITGVPFFVLDEIYPIPGAQPPETILAVVDRVLQKRATAAPASDAATLA